MKLYFLYKKSTSAERFDMPNTRIKLCSNALFYGLKFVLLDAALIRSRLGGIFAKSMGSISSYDHEKCRKLPT